MKNLNSYPGSRVPNLSQIKLTNTDEGPSIPSLSSFRLSVKFFVPGVISTGLSCSLSLSAMDPAGRGSPWILISPIVEPTLNDSETKKVSDEAPVSR